jgi:hypothetical protein
VNGRPQSGVDVKKILLALWRNAKNSCNALAIMAETTTLMGDLPAAAARHFVPASLGCALLIPAWLAFADIVFGGRRAAFLCRNQVQPQRHQQIVTAPRRCRSPSGERSVDPDGEVAGGAAM